MKLAYFVTMPAVMLALLLSGCSSEAGDNGRSDKNQMLEATVPETAIPKTDKPGTAMHETAMPGTALQADPGVNLPYGGLNISPSQVVAKNVRLDKENIGGMSDDELRTRLEQIAAKSDVAAINAGFNEKTWTVTKEKAGKKLDIDQMVKTALSAREGSHIKYAYKSVKPEVTAAQLKTSVKQIAKFTTPLLDRSKSRVKNIRLASKKN